MKIRTAKGFMQRLRGWWPQPQSNDADVLRFERCRCIHTFGMRETIDVVFIDPKGRILGVHTHVRPWRVVAHPQASEVWELRAGRAAAFDLRPGRAVPKQRGASLIEVLLALVLVIWPLASALMEYSQLAVSRHALHHAAHEVARAVERIDDVSNEMGSLRRTLAYHLLPVAASSANPLQDEWAILRDVGAAQALALRPDRLALKITAVQTEVSALSQSAQEIHVEARWCRELFFAPARQMIVAVAIWGVDDIFEVTCLAMGGFPLRADAQAWRPLSRARIVSP